MRGSTWNYYNEVRFQKLDYMDQVGWRVLVTTRHSRRGKVVEETSRTVLRQIEEIIFDDEKVENVA